MIKMGRLIKGTLALVVGVYLCSLAVLYAAQDNLIFPASKVTIDSLPEYASFAEMKTEDGITLKHIRLAGDEGAPKVMFFHGNGSLASAEIKRGRILQENGFDVLLVEYRGYGGSDGEASADAILKDSLAVYDWYNAEKSEWVFLYGHSLGTGVASYVSANRSAKSMVLEAPFTSLSDIAASKHPIFPVRMLLKHEMETSQYLKDNKTPLLIVHGQEDRVVPVKYGRTLYEGLDPAIAKMEILNDAGHNDLIKNSSIDLALGHFSKSF